MSHLQFEKNYYLIDLNSKNLNHNFTLLNLLKPLYNSFICL